MSDSQPQEKQANWFSKHRVLTVIAVVLILFIFSSALGGGKSAPSDSAVDNSSKSVQADSSAGEPKPKEDLSKVKKEYTLTAGYYTAGVDIPAGKADVVAVSGRGNLSSSNLYSGGVNEMFGVDDGSGMYTAKFNGLQLPKDATLSLNGNLQIKLTFSKIDSSFTGRKYNEAAAKTFSSGNYTAGEDFNAGVYKIVAVSGNGNLSSSNIYNGGVNEMFGIDDGSGTYNSQFLNADFKDGATLTITGGLVVKLTPAK